MRRPCSPHSSLLVVVGAGACHDGREPERVPEVRSADVNTVSAGTLTLPNRATSVKFAVIGDSGRGTPPQHEIAAQMVAFRRLPMRVHADARRQHLRSPATREDYRRSSRIRIAPAGRGVVAKFYAVLGNHDDPRQVVYPLFNMDGERYYSFSPPEDLLAKVVTRVEFFALDSTNLDRAQRGGSTNASRNRMPSGRCAFHHPLYTSGRYRSWSRGSA